MLDFSRLPNLHLGPMSPNVIEATVAFAKTRNWPLCLIASRRQIDSEEIGGGYVGNLSTEQFSKNLQSAVKSGHVILARDHGGPYQRSEESELSLEDAIKRVESSFQTDISCGFNIIHLDPEKCIAEGAADGLDTFTELTKELLSRCFAILDKTGRKDVRFEVGSDEGIGMEFVPEQWAEFLENITDFCASENRPGPIAIAVPLGTKVKEAENIGGLALNIKDPFWIKRVQAMLEVSKRFGVKLKLHNADYIESPVLRKYLELGVEQINVAPELGVLETKALLNFLRKNKLKDLEESFLSISYNSMKWERWLKPDTNASDEDKAIIAGHYVFSTPECQEVFNKIKALPKGRELQPTLIKAITKGIENYYTVMAENYALVGNVSY